MNRSVAGILILTVALTGCVSKSEMKAREKAAFLAGQQQAVVAQANASSVWVVGNVRNPSIPWTEDLTLSKALVDADYLGPTDPNRIAVFRNGNRFAFFTGKQLLSGHDMHLLAGDRVEIRP